MSMPYTYMSLVMRNSAPCISTKISLNLHEYSIPWKLHVRMYAIQLLSLQQLPVGVCSFVRVPQLHMRMAIVRKCVQKYVYVRMYIL